MILEIKRLTKHFDGVHAVDDVSFCIDKSSITSLIGPNGAGKTTLFNIISGYIESDKGYVAFEGEKLNGSAPNSIASLGIGRTFQNIRLIGKISTIDNIMLAFGNRPRGGFLGALARSISRKEEKKNRTKAFKHLEFVGLVEKADEPAETLSYGQQKLLNLACCLALDAKLLMLDEPVAGVNQETIMRILSLLEELRDGGFTIFLIEHNLDAVMKVSDRLIVMDEGRIIADGVPSVVKENPTVIEAYLS
jgi:branched-chain amino acid transport system ATP-binding protein